MLSFTQALHLLEAGATVRRKSWPAGQRIIGRGRIRVYTESGADDWFPTSEDAAATDWTVTEEGSLGYGVWEIFTDGDGSLISLGLHKGELKEIIERLAPFVHNVVHATRRLGVQPNPTPKRVPLAVSIEDVTLPADRVLYRDNCLTEEGGQFYFNF